MTTIGAPMESLRSGSRPQWPAEEVQPTREESGGGGVLWRKSAASAAIRACVAVKGSVAGQNQVHVGIKQPQPCLDVKSERFSNLRFLNQTVS